METLFLILLPADTKQQASVVFTVRLLQAALTHVSRTLSCISRDHLCDCLNAADFCLFSPLSW